MESESPESTEVVVTVPAPEPPPAPVLHQPDTAIAMAVGEIRGQLTAQNALLEQIVRNQSESADALRELSSRTELLLNQESEPEEEEETESVEIPPPLLVEPAAPVHPITPVLQAPGEPPKRRLGMLHGW